MAHTGEHPTRRQPDEERWQACYDGPDQKRDEQQALMVAIGADENGMDRCSDGKSKSSESGSGGYVQRCRARRIPPRKTLEDDVQRKRYGAHRPCPQAPQPHVSDRQRKQDTYQDVDGRKQKSCAPPRLPTRFIHHVSPYEING